MFAKVEYDGFDGRPDLRALAERGTGLLTEEVGPEWHEKLTVAWVAPPGRAELTLTVTLRFPHEIGVGTQTAPATGLADPEQFRFWLGRVWMKATGDYLNRRKPAWDAIINESVEV